jgi:hypothetical protein
VFRVETRPRALARSASLSLRVISFASGHFSI